jgi:hypothetical protein
MNWQAERGLDENGRNGGKHQTTPTCQIPFLSGVQKIAALLPVEGGQDDLMVWLGKQWLGQHRKRCTGQQYQR